MENTNYLDYESTRPEKGTPRERGAEDRMDVSLTSDSREEGPTAEEDDNVHVHVPDALSAETVLSDDVRSEVLTCDDVINIPGSPETDREVLVQLYETTGGKSWEEQSGWAEKAADLGTWWGVTTNAQGRVEKLALEGGGDEGNNVLGRIPQGNNLEGAIPKELGELAALRELTLSGNKLNGAIPKELGNLTNLESLHLVSNKLDGAIPKELGELAALRQLRLNVNKLSGGIPKELGNLTCLQGLRLGGNQLDGGIPKELGNLTCLQGLGLGGNQLDGGIPKELGNLTCLKVLFLFDNQLDGGIPKELGNLTSLQFLSLGDNTLDGGIPKELGNLTCLRELVLWGNQLVGGIPKELGNLTSLQFLSLGNNKLDGFVPWELGKLGGLTSCQLGDNKLCGLWDEGRQSKQQDCSSPDGHHPGAVPSELTALIGVLERAAVVGWAEMLKGNPWRYPPAVVVNAGASAVRGYFTSAFAEGSDVFERPLKVVLIGKETVGKTSLRQSMREKKPCRTADAPAASTVHIDVEDLKIKGDAIRVFDCAGQEAYHGSLQLFFTEHALYLLVVDMASAVENIVEDAQDFLGELGVLQWVRSLAYRVPQAAVVLVGTKCDLVESTASQSSLARLEAAAAAIEPKIRSRVSSWSTQAAARRERMSKIWTYPRPSEHQTSSEIYLEPGMRLVSFAESAGVPPVDGGTGWPCDVNEPGLLNRIVRCASGIKRAVSVRLPYDWHRAVDFIECYAKRPRDTSGFRGVKLADLREEWLKQQGASQGALEGALLLRGSEGGLVVYGAFVFFNVDWFVQVLKPLLSHKPVHSEGRTLLGEVEMRRSPMLDRFEERGILEPALARELWGEETAPHVLETLMSAGLVFPLAGDKEGGLVVLLRLSKDRPAAVGDQLEQSRWKLERDGKRNGQIKVVCNFLSGVPPGFIERLLTKWCHLGSCKLFWRFGVFIQSKFFSAIFGYKESEDAFGQLSLDVYGDCTTAYPWAAISTCLSVVVEMLSEFPGMDSAARLDCQQHPSLSTFTGMEATATLECRQHSSPGVEGIPINLSQPREWAPLIRDVDGCPSCPDSDQDLARLLLLYVPVADSSFELESIRSKFDEAVTSHSEILSQWAEANEAVREKAAMAKRLAAEEAGRKRLEEEAERKQLEDEAERKLREDKAERNRLEDEAERKRLEGIESERRRLEEEEDTHWSNVQKGFGGFATAFFAAFVAFAAVDDPKSVLWGFFLALGGVSTLAVLGVYEARRRIKAKRATAVGLRGIP